MTNNLVQTWVSVTDLNGRERLEARWTPAPESGAPVHAPLHDAAHGTHAA